MDKKDIKSAYKRFNAPVVEDPEWFKKYEFILIRDMDMLRDSFKDWKPGESYMSFDTETNDLDAEKLSIVGYSYSLNGKQAYYVPINHYNDTYNLGDAGTDFIYERMCEAKRVFMFNARFDMRVFEYIGFDAERDSNRLFRYIKYDMEKVNLFDVSIACWLADTNIKMPSLKDSALVFLGYRMQHFGEVTADAENFQFVDPEDCCFYAASDALCTYLLVGATMKYFQEANMAAKIDNKVLYPLMHYEQEKIWLDKELLGKFVVEGEKRLEELERSIYQDLGYSINLNSPAQVSQAFNRLGIDTGQRTASGYMKTGVDDLESLPDHIREKYPTLDKFVEYKTLFKQISSYAKVLYKEAEERGYVRCSYKNQQVPTGRLASGKDSKNTFFSPLNTQSIPKPHVLMHYVFDLHDRTIFSKKKNIMMGFEFVPARYDENKKVIIPESTNERTYLGLAEGMRNDLNMRASYTPKIVKSDGDDDCVFINIDYAAQELRVPANLSGEPTWTEAFCSGGDVHKSTACVIWGEENYNKDYRKMAKGANFCETNDNFVLTDKGYLHPSEITRDEVLITRDGSEDKIENIVRVPDEPCISIYFDSGITGTYHERHKLLCATGNGFEWVEVRNLTIEDNIVSFYDKRCKNEHEPHMIDLSQYTNNEENLEKYGISIDANSDEFAYLMGLYLGSGYLDIKEDKRAGVYTMPEVTLRQCVDIEECDKVIDKIVALGFDRDSIEISGYEAQYVRVLRYGGKGFGRYVLEHFGRSADIKVPEFALYDWCESAVENFIEGLVDSGGARSKDGNTKFFFTTKVELLSRIALLCNYVGRRTYYEIGDDTVWRGRLTILDKVSEGSGWYTVRVLGGGRVTEDIYAIQCAKHEYISNNMNSHNSILYGAVASSFAADPSYHMSEYEAEEFYVKYKEALPTLFQWVDRVQRRARKTGTAYTYFGRPRRVKGYFDNRQFSFANRTITNTIVQGTSSDILKIVMCKLWKNVLNNPKYMNDVRFGLTVHDEIDYKCRAKRANEIGRVLEINQEFKLPEWRVPIAVEVSFGWTWGQAFAYEWVDEEKQYYPKLD